MTVVAPFVLQLGTGAFIALAALFLVVLIAPILAIAVLFDVYRTNRRIADSLETIEGHLGALSETAGPQDGPDTSETPGQRTLTDAVDDATDAESESSSDAA